MAEPRSFLDVNLGAVRYNINSIISAVPGHRLLAVVKANAYGVGVKAVSTAASECGCYGFGVATCQEALQLRSFGETKPIYMLSGFFDDELEEAVLNEITLPVTSVEAAKRISAVAVKLEKVAEVNLVIDSGMGRVGLLPVTAASQIAEISALPMLKVVGLYSHFSSAGEQGDEYTLEQLKLLKAFLAETPLPAGCRDIHFAAFDGINNYPESVTDPFTMARCGIGMYGMAEANTLNIPLKPALRFSAKVAEVRELPAGSCIGYMHTVKLSKKSRIAVVAAGYADGLPLGESNRGRFLINGVSCPVIGRISMDYTTCDLGDAPCKAGDSAVIFGSDGNSFISVSEVAGLRNSHDYDVLCSVGPRTGRRYIG
ncbi:MAG: alanine racemase [Lentisphaeria bacterium]|nr:alanine racemase [Lentisphaeria bacterium]